MMKKVIKLRYAIIIYILVFIFSTGATYALNDYWASGNTLLSGSTMCFDVEYSTGESIDMSGLTASLEFTEGSSASTTLSFSRKTNCELYGKGTITANVTTNSEVNLSSGGLKYRVIKNNETEPVATGSVSKSGESIIYDDFYILDMVDTYTVYFWLDANNIDNTYLDASFSGTVGSSAISTPNYPGHIDEDVPVTTELLANFYYYDDTEEKVDYITETCVGTGDICVITIPEEVTSTTGEYGNSYAGVSTSTGNMTYAGEDKVEITENTSFYTLYSTEVNYKYYDTEWKEESVYRNSYINSSNELVTVLADTETSTESITVSSSSNANLLGYSNTESGTVSHESISDITNSNSTSMTEVYQLVVNYTKGDGVSSIGKTTDSCNFTSPSTTCSVTTPSISVNEGYKALGWYDTNNKKVADQNTGLTISTNNVTYTAKASDSSVPVCLINTTSTLKSGSQTATLNCTDNLGITKYYFGTDSNGTPNTEIDSTTSMNITKTIDASGTYYLIAEDTTGNTSEVVSQTYYSYTVDNYLLNVTGTKNTYTTNNYTKASSNTYIAPKDTTITMSSIYMAPTGGEYVAASVGVASTTAPTTATSATLTGNSTYTMWFNRLEYTITVATSTGGSNKVTTQNNTTGVTATSSSESKTITIRYGEKLISTATNSTGYTFSSFSGLLTSTTNTVTVTPNTSGTITANFTANTYTINYYLNDGTLGSSAPTSGTYDSVVTISNPTKDGWTFTGWTFDGDTSLAKYGTSSSAVTTSWSDASTYVTAEYFKNLTSTSGGTITLTAHWEKEMIGTFYYYNGSSQATKTSTCMLYDTDTLCSFTIPSEVTSSTGLDDASYYGVSTSPSSTTITTTYNSNNLNYYAVYKGSWTATYTKEDTVSSIGSTSNSCTNYKTTNGTTYTSNSCSVTLPAINVDSEHVVLGWYNSSNNKVGDAGASISLSSNITYTAKARQLAATDLYYDNTNTGVDCSDAQCMIDEINEILESKE